MDVEELLEPISDEMPCGEEGSLFALEEIVKEQGAGIVAGTEVEASEPNWSQLLEEATSQFGQCKHLRTALFLTLAAMNREGVTGFRDGLSLIKGLIERYWDTMYPELDPDESMGDPDGWMERENILNDMSAPLATVGDAMKFLQRLRDAPLTNSRQLGRFSLKDIQAALAAGAEGDGDGGEEGEPNDAPKMSLIQGAFEDTDQDELEAMHQGVSESLELLDGIKEALSEKLSQSIPPTFDNVVGMLQDMHKPVHRELDRRGFFDDGSGDDDFGDSEDGDDESGSGEGDSDGGGSGGDMASAGINTRQDVLKAFGLIYKYYSNNEPSSPVPLIMKRAERLVTASFMDIISDLSPSAMGEVETVTGGSSAGMMDSDDFGSDSSGDDDDM